MFRRRSTAAAPAVASIEDKPLEPRKALKFIPVRNETNIVLALMGLAGGLFALIAVVLILVLNNYALANRSKVYVQLKDGTTDSAQEFDGLHRDPEIIKKTIATWMQLTFEWDIRIPGSEELDAGIKIDRDRVTSKSYLASYLLQDGFREAFLLQLSRDVIPSDVFHGSRRSLVRFYRFSSPRQVGDGRWEVDVLATRIESNPTRKLKETRLNRTITVQAIPYVPPVLGENEPLVWRKTIYDLLSNGLLITDVVPLKDETQK